MDDEIALLDRLLIRLQLLDPPYRESEEGKQLYQQICKLVFEDQIYLRIWSEPTLNQLDHLFQLERPGNKLFDVELQEIRERTIAVNKINDFFFGIVDPNMTSKDLCKRLEKIHCLPENFTESLDASNRLHEVRNQDQFTSEKIACFLEVLKDDLSVNLTTKNSIKGALESLKSREAAGRVNVLLVKGTGQAITVSLHIKLQPGSGLVRCQIKGSEDFKDAVGRAQSAMRDRGFLSGAEDILYALNSLMLAMKDLPLRLQRL
jgi:hypothetical protein